MKRVLFIASALLVFFTACHKGGSSDNSNTNTTTTPAGSALDMIHDSIYLYTQESYYWSNQLPSYTAFNPRSFTGSTDIAGLTNEVNHLSQYAINPSTSLPYEYYS